MCSCLLGGGSNSPDISTLLYPLFPPVLWLFRACALLRTNPEVLSILVHWLGTVFHSSCTCNNQPFHLHSFGDAFIHSFIQAISIAPLQVRYYSEALLTQHGYCVSRRSATSNCPTTSHKTIVFAGPGTNASWEHWWFEWHHASTLIHYITLHQAIYSFTSSQGQTHRKRDGGGP